MFDVITEYTDDQFNLIFQTESKIQYTSNLIDWEWEDLFSHMFLPIFTYSHNAKYTKPNLKEKSLEASENDTQMAPQELFDPKHILWTRRHFTHFLSCTLDGDIWYNYAQLCFSSI